MITVILPAAGKGTRLGLPYSKELMHVGEGQALIDFSFDHFRNYGRKDVEFVVIINEHKTDIVQYLAKYKDRYNITFTFQDPGEFEYTGAIKSAIHLFGDRNIVLLPDTVMILPTFVDLGEAALKAVENTGFSFFYKAEADFEMLKTKGALFIDNERKALMYEDKPRQELERFNAFWCGFAFTEYTFDRVIEYMERTTFRYQQTREFKNTPLYKSQGIEVEDYTDLGTWGEIRRWHRKFV